MFGKIKNGFFQAWKWLSGKKRWIAIAAGLIAKVTPEHTLGHQIGSFIKDNAEAVFQVAGALAIGEIAVQKVKEKLPSGVSTTLDMTKLISFKIKKSEGGDVSGTNNN